MFHTNDSDMDERSKPIKRGSQSKSKDAEGDVVMAERSEALSKVKISYKQKAMEMPSPPPEMSKDATAMDLVFFLPTPSSDRKRVLVNGPTDILTVNDVTDFDKNRTHALHNFVTEQFPKMEKITVQFRLCEKASPGAMQHVVFILRHLVKLGKACTFVVQVESLREELSEDEKEKEVKKARKKFIEISHKLAGSQLNTLKIEDDRDLSSMFDGPPPSPHAEFW
jgi:hypothetical protein